MANQVDQRSSNQPSKEAQIKSGPHSHAGSTGTSAGSMDNQRDTDRINQSGQNQGGPGQGGQNQGNKNQPSKEAQVKGGQHSHSGSGSGGTSSGSSGNG